MNIDINPGWTDARTKRTKALWQDGLSASQIAADLGHVTRNSVISKLHRLGASERVKGAAPAKRHRPQKYKRRAPRIAAEPTPLPAEPLPPPGPPAGGLIAFFELTATTCRWPHGDGPFLFCGAVPAADKPYCACHCEVAYTGTRHPAPDPALTVRACDDLTPGSSGSRALSALGKRVVLRRDDSPISKPASLVNPRATAAPAHTPPSSPA